MKSAGSQSVNQPVKTCYQIPLYSHIFLYLLHFELSSSIGNVTPSIPSLTPRPFDLSIPTILIHDPLYVGPESVIGVGIGGGSRPSFNVFFFFYNGPYHFS